jgi:hypothetical protein
MGEAVQKARAEERAERLMQLGPARVAAPVWWPEVVEEGAALVPRHLDFVRAAGPAPGPSKPVLHRAPAAKQR